MTSDTEMAGGDNDPRRVSTGAGIRAASAGQSGDAATAPPVPADPSAKWLEEFFAAKVQTDSLQDGTRAPCVMLGERPEKGTRTGRTVPFEKKIDDERVTITARTIDETISYLTAYVVAAEPVDTAATKFRWPESIKVSKFGDLCQGCLERYWENATNELFPEGIVPDAPGTYDRVF